jgi:hypothetical protein
MTISKKDMENILVSNMEDDARKVFLSMPREEQLLAILGMEASNSNRLAVVERSQIEFGQDLSAFKKELRAVRADREMREQKDKKKLYGDLEGDDETSTTQKVAKAIAQEFAKRFDFWTWARDRILPPILIAICLGILYLVFGGHLP